MTTESKITEVQIAEQYERLMSAFIKWRRAKGEFAAKDFQFKRDLRFRMGNGSIVGKNDDERVGKLLAMSLEHKDLYEEIGRLELEVFELETIYKVVSLQVEMLRTILRVEEMEYANKESDPNSPRVGEEGEGR